MHIGSHPICLPFLCVRIAWDVADQEHYLWKLKIGCFWYDLMRSCPVLSQHSFPPHLP